MLEYEQIAHAFSTVSVYETYLYLFKKPKSMRMNKKSSSRSKWRKCAVFVAILPSLWMIMLLNDDSLMTVVEVDVLTLLKQAVCK